MTSVQNVNRILPGSPQWTELLAGIAAGAKDRDLNDENPFDQVSALKRAVRRNAAVAERAWRSGIHRSTTVLAVIDVARADPIVAHIFRTHFWFTEERLLLSDLCAFSGGQRR
jgi:hypothetical protein